MSMPRASCRFLPLNLVFVMQLSGYQVLISLAAATGDVVAFLRVVTSALASNTCHMRSAAVDASSRLVFEFARGDAKMQQALPALLQTVLILFNEQSREVLKSAIGLVRVCVTAMDPDSLRLLLPEVVGSLLTYHKGKDRFRKKIKIIFKKLVRLYGYDTLMPLIPDSESRLLVHMRKLDERAQRRKSSNRGERAPDTLDYDQLVDSDEYDSDDGKTLISGATGLTRMTRQTRMTGVVSAKSGKTQIARQSKKPNSGISRLPNENDGEVVNILSLKEKGVPDNDDTDDDTVDEGAIQFDDAGRLVVFDEGVTKQVEPNLSNGVLSEGGVLANKRRRLGTDSISSRSVASAKSSKHTNGKGAHLLGASYKSWKAGGDVMKKGQRYEPYAYVPLDGRSYSKKNRRRAVEQMSTVVPPGGKRKRK
jgi:ribosomal RNA-processing protein 12